MIKVRCASPIDDTISAKASVQISSRVKMHVTVWISVPGVSGKTNLIGSTSATTKRMGAVKMKDKNAVATPLNNIPNGSRYQGGSSMEGRVMTLFSRKYRKQSCKILAGKN